MQLNNHIFYVDITNVCDLNCRHCMYARERKLPKLNLILSERAKANLDCMINDPETSGVAISGEGEPFANRKTLEKILELSKGRRSFSIITSGNWPLNQIGPRIKKFHSMARQGEDKYKLRVSLDSFHTEQISQSKYLGLIEAAPGNPSSNLQLSFRALVEEKEFVKNFLESIAKLGGFDYQYTPIGELESQVSFSGKVIPLEFKNFTNPDQLQTNGLGDIFNYLNALEQRYGRKITLGNLTGAGQNGVNLLVKPSGDVFFFGFEVRPFANIHRDEVSMQYFANIVNTNPLLSKLYSVPLAEILAKLAEKPHLAERIRQINNPFWIIKSLYPDYRADIERAAGAI